MSGEEEELAPSFNRLSMEENNTGFREYAGGESLPFGVTHRSQSRRSRDSLLGRLQTTAEDAQQSVGQIETWVNDASDVINKEFSRSHQQFSDIKSSMAELKGLILAQNQANEKPATPPPNLYGELSKSPPPSKPSSRRSSGGGSPTRSDNDNFKSLLKAVKNDDNKTFKVSSIGYFDPHLSQATYGKGDFVVIGEHTWFRDVHLFISQAKTQAKTLGSSTVRKNLHLCLRGTAQAWYVAELDDVYRTAFHGGEGIQMWEKHLIQRFKIRASDAMSLLQADELSIDDIRSQRSVSDYVQSVARHARDAGFKEEYQQVLWAWNHLAPSLQRDIDEPSEKSTLLSFIMQLESRKTAWGRFYAQKVPENLQRPQRQQNWASSRQNNGQPSYNSQGNQPDQQQQQALRNWNGPRQQSPQPQSQRRIEAPPRNNWGPKLNPSYNQQQKAFFGNVKEEDGCVYYGETADNTENSNNDELPPDAYPAHGLSVNFNNTGDVWKDLAPWTCNLCPIPQSFGNADELADHGVDFHGVDPRSSAQKYVRKQLELEHHARDNVYTFTPGSEGYATANTTVFDTNLQACIDTGSGASVIDWSLLPRHQHSLILENVMPVTLKGVCGLQLCDKVAKFNLQLGDNEINVPMRAYVVEDLQAGLIIGLGQLEALDAVLHIRKRIMTVGDKSVKLTYSGGTDSGLSSMHLGVSTPTFIVHEQRQRKWAALTNSMEKPGPAGPMFKFKPANQNQAQLTTSNDQIPAHEIHELTDQSASRNSASNSASTGTTPHACRRCTFATSSNRKLRRHRCPRLPQHQRRDAIGQTPVEKSMEKGQEKHLEKWDVIGKQRRVWEG